MEEKQKPVAAPQNDPFSFGDFGAAPAAPSQPAVVGHQPAQPNLFEFGESNNTAPS